LIVLTGVAWALMLHHAISMSEPMGWDGAMGVEMSDANFTLGGLGIFLAVWTVMMGAMMLPSAAPMILTLRLRLGAIATLPCPPGCSSPATFSFGAMRVSSFSSLSMLARIWWIALLGLRAAPGRPSRSGAR